MYGHAPHTTPCAEPDCPTPAIVTDDDDPTLVRCVPHAMARLRSETTPAAC